MEGHVYLPISALELYLVWICAGPVCAATLPVSSHVHSPVVSGRHFPWCHPSLWLLHLSTPSSTEFPELWGEGFDEDMPFGTECSKVSHILPTVQMWVSVLVPSYCRRKLSSVGSQILIYGYSRMPLGVVTELGLWKELIYVCCVVLVSLWYWGRIRVWLLWVLLVSVHVASIVATSCCPQSQHLCCWNSTFWVSSVCWFLVFYSCCCVCVRYPPAPHTFFLIWYYLFLVFYWV